MANPPTRRSESILTIALASVFPSSVSPYLRISEKKISTAPSDSRFEACSLVRNLDRYQRKFFFFQSNRIGHKNRKYIQDHSGLFTSNCRNNFFSSLLGLLHSFIDDPKGFKLKSFKCFWRNDLYFWVEVEGCLKMSSDILS